MATFLFFPRWTMTKLLSDCGGHVPNPGQITSSFGWGPPLPRLVHCPVNLPALAWELLLVGNQCDITFIIPKLINEVPSHANITLLRYITMFTGLSIFQRIFHHLILNMRNILQNIVNPTKQCYGSEQSFETSFIA